jgi:hypothetical protein
VEEALPMPRTNSIAPFNPYAPHRQFRREDLPAPLTYYASENLKLVGRGIWRSALCPFHQDHRPSLRVNMQTGAFKCMSCGAHGGDVLEYHRKRYGMGFVNAAKDLGAWVGA